MANRGSARRVPPVGVHTIDTGTCELVQDGDRWTVLINGVPSSSINLANPHQLDFGYMRWIAALAETRWSTPEPLKMLHLGAGACTLPRYLAATFPASRHVAVEVDARLATLVREWFDLPKAPLLRIRAGEARQVAEELHPASRDLVVRDVFAGDATPYALTTVEFAAHVKRILKPGGVFAVNSGSLDDPRGWRDEIATLGGSFATLAVVGEAAVLRGRRQGNVVVAVSDSPLPSQEFARRIHKSPVPMTVLFGDEARALGSFARHDRP
ncbi:fused MFS/spermidine synthase [Hoyosella sp. YIM 151337]|uniref:spermidine synthase n=1 Tax=Hoyosella sp. YIM 151337 TaxID=2992742 RepID=UPI002235ED86|nr:fused MFS/spermidine synthase [Hoyosella sp. YIM 151337]MCW4354271.1 fused MFS/spermidine synthase [Hoyosella sp. YIM 151337]